MILRNLAFCLLLAVTGCSMLETVSGMFSSDDNVVPPASLVEFRQSLNTIELWSERIGIGTDEQYLKLTPAYARQRLYAVDVKGRLLSLDATNGRKHWSRNTINSAKFWSKSDVVRITGGPGYGEDTLLLGTNVGDVIAYNSADGKELWRAQVSSEILSTPKKSSDKVIVRTSDGKLYALNGDNGRRLWVYDRAVPSLSLRGTGTPVIQDDIVVAGFDEGRLTALDLKTGRLLWEVRITTPRGSTEIDLMVDIDAEPIIVKGVIYVASFQGNVAAVQLETGRILWTRDLSSYAGFSADDDNLYISDQDSHIHALDRYSGEPIWEQDSLHMRNITAPAGIGDYLVVGDLDGYLHWMEKSTGAFVARTRVSKDPFIATPIVVGKVLYAFCSDGKLAAYTYR
jgi:outer membrane protein assembly factor BamB